MARQEQPRENLLRDATALTPRVLLRLPRSFIVQGERCAEFVGQCQTESATPITSEGDEFQEVFAGWRGEALSLFFDQDPVYHFDSAGNLRRSYAQGELIKATSGRLVRLKRERAPGELALVSREMSPAEQAAFILTMGEWLKRLNVALANGEAALGGQEPPAGDAVQRLAAWLQAHPEPTIADRPHVG